MFFCPSKATKLIGLPLVCLAMFSVAGGHWAILQTVAWGQMLITYSQEAGSFVLGAKKTFSGEAPCSLCKKIATAKKQEQKSPAPVKIDKKSDPAIVRFGSLVPIPAPCDHQFFPFEGKFFTRSEAPPTPVPIARS